MKKIYTLLFLLGLFNILLQAQNISYQVDIDDLYSSDCSDCYSGPDYRFRIRMYQNGTEVVNWNPDEEDSGWCLWYGHEVGDQNFSFWDNTNAPASTYINLSYNAWEADDWTCGGNDGDCGGYSSPNGNQTITSTSAGTWHYYYAPRSCSGVNWNIYYSLFWNYLPLNVPPAPTSYGSACGLGLNATNSTQTAVTWYWQTSSTGTDFTYPANNPPSVPNGTTTYYLRPYGNNSLQWGTASTGLTLNKSCAFRCYGTSANPPVVSAYTNFGTPLTLGSSGAYQNTMSTNSQFATGSYITEVSTDASDYGNYMQLVKNATSPTSLVDNALHAWSVWDGLDPNEANWKLATDNPTGSNFDPGTVSLQVCACKQASAGTITSSAGSSACPNETFTLSHDGSLSSRFDEQGYGDELRWYTGSCGGTLVGSGLTITVNGPGIETTVTYYAQFWADGAPCGACKSYAITYVDNTAPVVVCPSPQTDVLDGNCEWTVPDYRSLATITDNCVAYGDLTITQSPASGTNVAASHGSVQNVTITANDGFGNSNSCTFAVTLTDNIAPTILCKSYTLNLNALGAGTLAVANVDDGSFDNCDASLAFTLSKSAFTCADIGVNNVTLTGTDDAGNNSSCIAEVTVVDNTSPTAICQNYTLALDASGNGTLTTANINNGSNDACGIASLSLSKTAFTCSDVGSNIVTLTVNDNNGNSSTCNATVTVTESVPTSASAGNDDFICSGSNIVLGANTPIVGTGQWTWSGPGTVSYVVGSSTNPNATVSFSTGGLYTGTWTISGNCSSSSDAVVIGVNMPDIITTTAGSSGTCTSNGVNNWVHLFDNNGNIIASVNDNGNLMGNVTVAVPSVGNATPSYVCSSGLNSYMGRYFRFFSTNVGWYGNNVNLRLYFTTAELASLISEAGCGDANGCADDDDVCSIADVVATKYATGTSPGSPGGLFITPIGNGYDATFQADYVDIVVNNFSDIYLHGSEHNVPLPVELISFEAKSVNNQFIKLNWATATEINNAGFEIERSTDGFTYEKIGWAEGYNNSNETHYYSYQDNEVSKGVYYYRLKQIDNDGQYEYSEIRSATITGNNKDAVSFFIPNPAEHTSKINVSFATGKSVSIHIANVLGQTIDSKEMFLEEGVHDIVFDLNAYQAGTYMATIKVGNETYLRKLVVAK